MLRVFWLHVTFNYEKGLITIWFQVIKTSASYMKGNVINNYK